MWSWLARDGDEDTTGHLPSCDKINNDEGRHCRRSSFGCHVVDNNVAPSGMEEVSWLTSNRRRLLYFVGAGSRSCAVSSLVFVLGHVQ